MLAHVSSKKRMMEGQVTLKADDDKGGSSSWVMEIEKLLLCTNKSVEAARWKQHSIYRVPEFIKDMTSSKAYRPWLVSLGPFHHGEPDLLPMEEHKRRALLHFVKRAGRPLGEFVAAIEEVADKLQDAYQGLDDNKWRRNNRGHFVQMMISDGCFLLEIMRMKCEPTDDYAPNDPVFSKHGLHHLYGAIRADMVVIENQLPLLALERLVAVQDGTPPCARDLNNKVRLFLSRPYFYGMDDLSLHPLDIFHNSFCGGRRQHEQSNESEVIIPTAIELREAGIHFKTSSTPWLHDVDFKNGVLSMPELTIDEGTEKEFLNLMVFEQLHGDAGNVVVNYLIFMDSIIDSERDARLLRSKGIVKSWISTDKAMTDLFNNLTKGATSNQSKRLNNVLQKVESHCAKRCNRWRAFFVHTYLFNPWVFISLVAAVILLVATLLQTMYTVVPYYNKG